MENLSKEEIFNSFLKRFSAEPGIIFIWENIWNNSEIIVGIDSAKYLNSLPDNFECYQILIMDVYSEKENCEIILDMFKSSQENLNLLAFKSRLSFLNEKLFIYENK